MSAKLAAHPEDDVETAVPPALALADADVDWNWMLGPHVASPTGKVSAPLTPKVLPRGSRRLGWSARLLPKGEVNQADQALSQSSPVESEGLSIGRCKSSRKVASPPPGYRFLPPRESALLEETSTSAAS